MCTFESDTVEIKERMMELGIMEKIALQEIYGWFYYPIQFKVNITRTKVEILSVISTTEIYTEG